MRQPTGNTPLLPGSLKNMFFPPEKEEYTYFARAKECPFASGDSVVKGAWTADASMLAYARHGAKHMPAVDFQENLARGGLRCLNQIGDWNAHGTQGYFAANDQFAILAFRGTEADDPVDVIDDADLVLVPELDHRPDGDEPRFALGIPVSPVCDNSRIQICEYKDRIEALAQQSYPQVALLKQIKGVAR